MEPNEATSKKSSATQTSMLDFATIATPLLHNATSQQHSPTCTDISEDDSQKPLIQQHKTVHLLRMTFRQLVVCTLGPSVGALLLAFIVGFGLDYGDLLNYEWTCGRVLLPSISRIINLPKERLLWHLGLLLHIGIRPVALGQAYALHRQIARNSSRVYNGLAKFASLVGLLAGFSELLFTVALTVVGERESGPIHVYFFVGFIVSTAIHQAASAISTRLSHSYATRKEVQFCCRVRIGIFALLIVAIPAIFLFFILYWQFCVRVAYDLFACCEYVAVLAIYAHHFVAMLDLRHFECHFIRHSKNKY